MEIIRRIFDVSVSLIISNPVNEEENNFNVPISTERVFQDFWMPIIEELDLKWARCFQSGIEIEKEDLDFVLKDLAEMQTWIIINMDNERGVQMVGRIKNLCQGLECVFKEGRNDIKVYIG